MLLTKKNNPLFLLVFAMTFTILSCSDDNEVIEQEDPQSQISNELRLRLIANSAIGQSNEEFQNKINWPQTISSTGPVCGVEIAVLAYELFDTNNNSLNEVNIVPWIAGQGLTFQNLVDEIELIAVQQYGIPVQAIFIAGLLVRPIDQNSFAVAEISNYATFSDFFDNCQSLDVNFQVTQGTFDFNIPMPAAAPVIFPNTQTPCATLDFPLDIVVADLTNPSVTLQQTVNEVEFLDYLQGNVNGFVFINFVYPMSLTLRNGTQVVANDATALEQILNQTCN